MLKRKSKVLISFLKQLGVVLMQTDNLSSTLQYTHGHVIKVSESQKYAFQHYKVWERKLLSICF